MTAYALGFVAACFVGMFVAGIVSDWLNRRAARTSEPTYTTTPDADTQAARADVAKARRVEAERRVRGEVA